MSKGIHTLLQEYDYVFWPILIVLGICTVGVILGIVIGESLPVPYER